MKGYTMHYAHRFIAVALIVLACLCCSMLGTALAETEEPQEGATVLYENNFDTVENGALPAGWSSLAVGSGATQSYAEDGAIVVKTTSGTGLLLLDQELSSANFVAEFDLTIALNEGATDTGRWAGFTYNYASTSSFWHSVIRKRGDVNMDYWSGSWSIVNEFKRNQGILFDDEVVRFKVTVFDNSVVCYINGEYAGHISPSTGARNAKIGFVNNSSIMKIDNLSITEAQEAGFVPSYVPTDVYLPDTKVSNPPSVVLDVTTSAQMQDILNGARPATGIFNINSQLEAELSGGNVSIDSLFAALNNKVMPAFYISDEQTADNLGQYLLDNNVFDAFIVADYTNADLVQRARAIAKNVRGVIDFSAADSAELTTPQVVSLINSNLANVAIMGSDVTKEQVFSLQVRLSTVWTKGLTAVEEYNALAKGVNGIITDNHSRVYQLLSSFTSETIVRQPIISGHRGVASEYPENTLEGFKRAYSYGAHAFELDLYLTTDNEIVIMHDSTINRTTNGTGNVESYTLAQLKEFNIEMAAFPGVTDKIPTLREVFEYFQDKDIVFQIEIKSGKAQLMHQLKDLIEEFGNHNQATIFSFSLAQLKLGRTLMPHIPAAVFYNSSSKDLSEIIPTYLRLASPLNIHVSTDYSLVIGYPSFIPLITARGLASWVSTLNTRSFVDDFAIHLGAAAVLTDYPQWTTDYITNITARSIAAPCNEEFIPKAFVGDTNMLVRTDIMLFGASQGETLVKTEGGYKAIAAGEYAIAMLYEVRLYRSYGGFKTYLTYTILTQTTTLTVS